MSTFFNNYEKQLTFIICCGKIQKKRNNKNEQNLH